MSDFTIISYPGTRDNSLLSLSEDRSRYMLPFGGKFRVVDFTLRNSFSCGARSTIIYNNFDDGLENYVNLYGPFQNSKFPPIKVISRDYSDIRHCYDIIMEANSSHYLIYNGDNPSIIDFNSIIKRYRAKRNKAVLYMLNIEGRPSMGHRILIAPRKTLLDVIDEAIEQERSSPNIFEMIMNIMINRGIKEDTFDALYWPVGNVPEYYELNRFIINNRSIIDLLYRDKLIQSKIEAESYARIGLNGRITGSFISDHCKINGHVENSIIYPGVEIQEGAKVKDSIILPFVKIGPDARITGTIIDESTDFSAENEVFNIGAGCRVGSEEQFIKNTDHPENLYSSITLIGKNCAIPPGIKIGGGCFISSGTSEKGFEKKKVIQDGDSV